MHTAQAQRVVRGVVTDVETGNPLPAAALYVTETGRGTIANAAGMYELRLFSLPAEVTVRHIGYETLRFVIDTDTPARVDISLTPVAYEMEELVVSDEDPAYNIMRKVIARKAEMLRHVSNYAGEVYTRFMLYSDFDLAQVQETIANHYWKNAGGSRSLVRARRMNPAGDRSMRFATTQHVPNFYDDTIEISGFRLVGPTHPSALNVYVFTLGGYRQMDGRRVYDIYFRPRSGFSTAFIGHVSVLDEEYVVLETGMRPSPDNVLPAPVRDWDAYYEQQFASFGDTLWLPVDLRIEGHVSFGRIGVSYPTARYTQVSRLTGQAVNVPVLDSLFQTERLISVAPNVDRQDYLFRWNPGLVPMTPKETEAVVSIDPRRTIDRTFRPIGLLANYTSVALEDDEGPANIESRENLLGGIYSSLRIFYNRVEGFYLGVERDVSIRPSLSARLKGGYGLSLDEPAYGGALTYRWGRLNEPKISPNQGFIRAGYDRDRPPQYGSGVYSRLVNSLTTYVGWEDYFDYYWRDKRFVEAGITSQKLRATLTASISAEEHRNVDRTRDNKGWFFGDRQRDNPGVSTMKYDIYSAGLLLGVEPTAGLHAGGNGLRLNVMHHRGEVGSPSFTRYEARGTLSVPTFFQRRNWPNELRVRAYASTYTGWLPPQFSGVLDVSRRPIAPFGAFKTLTDLPIKGANVWALYWEHDFATALFETLGMWRVARTGIGFTLHGAVGRAESTRFQTDVLSRYDDALRHEIGVSFTHFFNLPVRFDLTRSFTTGQFAAGIGLVPPSR